jgi:phosphatidate phosphatase APP1
VPNSKAHFGVVSDIDDTVLQTDAKSPFKLLKHLLLDNARTRLPFEGVAAFYQALRQNTNPIFYVSSSPWNIYDLLLDFLELNQIPLGPLLLRDWGSKPNEFLPINHQRHKLETIQTILTTYPELPFIFIGDSGQQDPEVYQQLVHLYPGRILCIYIRDVSTGSKRDESVMQLAKAVAKDKSELVLVANSDMAMKHAKSRGFVNG